MDRFELAKGTGIYAIDLGLWIESSKTLVLSDFHIGYEEELNQKGVLLPRTLYKDVIDRLEGIFAEIKTNPETIVINGDLKHEFGRISQQEWKETMRLIDYLERKCAKLVLVKGNHDTILGPIADKQNIKIVDEYILGDILILHGHKEPKETNGINTIIIGHEHPAVVLQEDVRREKYKCYLAGKYRGKLLLIQPSFNLLVEGTDVCSEPLLSPMISNIDNFDTFVVDSKEKKILAFGRIKELRHD